MKIDLDKLPVKSACVMAWRYYELTGEIGKASAVSYIKVRISRCHKPTPAMQHFMETASRTGSDYALAEAVNGIAETINKVS